MNKKKLTKKQIAKVKEANNGKVIILDEAEGGCGCCHAHRAEREAPSMKYKLWLILFIIISTCSLITAADAPQNNPNEPGMLDKILNFVIPIVCFGFFFGLIYKAFKEPIDKAIDWIREKMAPSEQPQQSVYHKYRNAYMVPGDIKYQ